MVVHIMTTRAESDWELGKMFGEIGELLTARHQSVAASDLPVEGMLPSFDGANRWLNSEPLTQGALAWACRRRPVLDLHVHQLAAHPGVLSGLVAEIQGPGPCHYRCAHPRVQVRARPRQRVLGDGSEKDLQVTGPSALTRARATVLAEGSHTSSTHAM